MLSVPPVSIVVLYIVLEALNLRSPRVTDLAHSAAKTLLLDVRALTLTPVRTRVSAGIVPQQPRIIVWSRESSPLTFVKDAVRPGVKNIVNIITMMVFGLD